MGELAYAGLTEMFILNNCLTLITLYSLMTVNIQGELHAEAQAYMKYLGEQVEKEKEAERELEKLIDAEVCTSSSRCTTTVYLTTDKSLNYCFNES